MRHLAEQCHSRFFEPALPISRIQERLARLADLLHCDQRTAIRCAFDLKLGLTRADVIIDRKTWRVSETGDSYLTFPLIHDGQIVNILALDLEENVHFELTGRASVIGRMAIDAAEFDGSSVTLFDTPMAWLRGWADYWGPQFMRSGRYGVESGAGLADDRDTNSPHFRGICLLDREMPLLPIVRRIQHIKINDEDYATDFSDRLQSEIRAEEKRRRYPIITLNRKEEKAA